MRRCEHSVYIPEWVPEDETKAPYCGICTPLEPLPPGGELFLHPSKKKSKYETLECPKCLKKALRYKNDYEFKCRFCGFDALTVF